MMHPPNSAAYCRQQAFETERIAKFTSVKEQKADYLAQAERWRARAEEAEAREREGQAD